MADKSYRILRIPAMNVACYLIYDDQSAILVDTGNKGSVRKVLEMLELLGLHSSSLKLVIVTHGHYDHAGSAREIKELTGAPIAIHKNDSSRLQNGYGPLPDGTRWKAKVLVWIGRLFLKRLGRFPSLEPDIILEDSFNLDQFGFEGKVLHMPGHTLGSVIVHLESGDAIVGDSLFGLKDKQIFPPFADDVSLLLESWKKMVDLPVAFYYPGHGQRISKKNLESEFPAALKRYGHL